MLEGDALEFKSVVVSFSADRFRQVLPFLSLRPGWYSNRAQATVSSYTSSTGTWDSVASMRTARLALATTTGLDGRIYSLGGTDSQSYFGSAETYDPEIDAWDAISPMPTARGWFASAAGLDGRIYAVGGRTNGGDPPPPDPLPTLEVYDPQTGCW